MVDIIFRLLVIVPIILITITVILIINGNKKLASYEECRGTIIGFYKNTVELRVGDYENEAISPIVEYYVNGERQEFVGNYYSTTMKIGDAVSVLYRSNDYADAVIKNGIRLGPIITGTLSIIFLIPVVLYPILKGKGII